MQPNAETEAAMLENELLAENARLRRAVQWAADTAFAAFGSDDETEALSEINNNCRAGLKECPANLND